MEGREMLNGKVFFLRKYPAKLEATFQIKYKSFNSTIN